MVVKTQKKLKHNAKTTKIKCVRCEENKIRKRRDAKYCSDLCKVQERLYRIEKGFIKLIVNELEKGLKAFYNEVQFQHKNPFIKELQDLEETNTPINYNMPFKLEFKDFILYYFSNKRFKKFEIHCNNEIYNKWKLAVSSKALFTSEPKKFTKVETSKP